MPTTVTRTIGSGGDYTTLQAWEDASPANLVTSDQVWRGECLSGFSSTAAVTIAGSTSDATRYKHLTAAAGASFADNANVRTNALRYNTANGVYIDFAGGYATAVDINEANAIVSRLQIRGENPTDLPVRLNQARTILEQCIVSGAPNGGGFAPAVINMNAGVASSVARNCLVERRSTTSVAAINANRATVVGCTIVNTSGTANSSGILNFYSGSDCTNRNNAVFGFTSGTNVVAATSSQTNICDVTSPGSGWTGGVAFSTATFTNVTSGSWDFRTVTGSALIDAGTTDATNGTPDISLTARSGTYDVGCWEFASGGGGATSLSARRAFPRPILNF
jgi:hypothetical protein